MPRPKRIRPILLTSFGVVILLPLGLLVAAALFIGPLRRCVTPRLPIEPGLHALALESGGMERCYLLYVPPSLDRSQPAPLVVNIHGFASNPRIQVATTRWNDIADREGLAVVYPQGTSFPLRWNTNPATNSPVDDVQFFDDLMAELDRVLTIDRRRVYLTGFSNGGGMTNRLICGPETWVTAAATVSGFYVDLGETCRPGRPVPLITFHGTADPIVPYAGGEVHLLPSLPVLNPAASPSLTAVGVEDWLAGWAERNSCDPTPQALPPGTLPADTHGVRYTGCRDGAEVVFYTIDGGGHTWPGSTKYGIGYYSRTDATGLIWEFFKAHTPAHSPGVDSP
jgi:polyhydroxybutyrate depolymerase